MANSGLQEGSAIIDETCTFFRRSTFYSSRLIDALTSTNELLETDTDHRPVVKTIEAIFEQEARITSCLTYPWT
jgi:hypothetical protein